MATTYPGALDALSNPNPTDPLSSASVPHASQHTNINDCIEAIQAKLGTGASIPALGRVLGGTGAGASAFRQITDADISAIANISYGKLGLGGSITSNDLVDRTVTGNDIALATMQDANFGANTIHGNKLQNESVSSTQILKGTITSLEIGNGQIVDAHFNAGAIHGNKIQSETLTGTQIANGTLSNSDLAPLTIRGGVDGVNGRIAGGSINGQDIAAESITNAHIVDGTVRVNELQENAATAGNAIASYAAFTANAGANVYVFDNANTPCTITIPVPGFVTVSFIGSFSISIGGSAYEAQFGIVRAGVHSTPPWVVRQYFYIANQPFMITAQFAENLPAGTHTYWFGAAPSGTGYSVDAVTSVHRSMIIRAMWR